MRPDAASRRAASADAPTLADEKPHGAGSTLTARTRIVAWMVLTVFIGLLAVVLLTNRVLRADAAAQANDAVTQEIEEFRQFAREGVDPDTAKPFTSTERIFEVYLRRQRPDAGEIIVGRLADGETLSVKGAMPGALNDYEVLSDRRVGRAIMSGTSGVAQTPVGDLRWGRVAVDSNGDAGGSLAVGIFMAEPNAAVARTTQLIAWIALGSLLLSAAISWLVARQILRPLHDMRRAAAAITERDLTQRLPVEGRDDIAELATTFNGLLDRLEDAFAGEQRFVDDAGHELRTPITIIRGHLELISEDPQERAATLALVTQELDRMSRIVSDLLSLARADRPDFVQPQPGVDLAELTLDLDAKVQALGDRHWMLGHVADGTCALDPQRVTQAVLQLAQNAVQHTDDGDTITLASRFTEVGGRPVAQFSVTDTGPGILPGETETIFERFAHGSSSRGQRGARAGAGLGLPIVAAIAEGHRGWVGVDSIPGEGATFTLTVPADGLVHSTPFDEHADGTRTTPDPDDTRPIPIGTWKETP
ncbi:sensor histidine kinase [Janibacter sp. G56]|uniref:sensor histidine kinase n=1 Tax=Janibacter sp. G56 TaxID=3418717 RepID=UPI003CFC2637